MRAAFDLSWWHLIDHDQLAARLFRLLSINPGPDISIAAAAAAAGQRSVPTGRQLRTLRRAHLVEPGISTDRWRMHDLVSLYSISLGEECAEDDDRESAQLRLVQYYSETANSAGGWINSLPSDKALGLFPNRGSGLKWLAAEQANLVASVRMAHAMNEYDVAIDLSCSIAPYLEAQRNLSDSLLVSEVALESARAMNIPVRETGVLNNIGIALTSMRRYKEAIRYLNKAVAKAKESGDGIEEATALTSLAGALRQYLALISGLRSCSVLYRLVSVWETHERSVRDDESGYRAKRSWRLSQGRAPFAVGFGHTCREWCQASRGSNAGPACYYSGADE